MIDGGKAVALVAVVAFWAVLAGAKMMPLWRRPVRRMIAFCRRPITETLVVAILAVGLVHRGATKGTGGTDPAAAPTPQAEQRAEQAAPSRDVGGGDELRPADDLRFTSFSADANAVSFGISVPFDLDLPGRKLDLFAAHDVDTNAWELVGDYDVPPGTTNLADSVALSDFPFPNMDRLFLVLGTRADHDEDGTSDAREKYVYGTCPLLADTDGDGLLDGEELAHVPPLDPLAADSDGDGYTDGEEAASGTNPLSPNGGAGMTIRYCYDEDDRLAVVCAGAAGATSVSALSPAGNPTRQASEGISPTTSERKK